MRQLQNLAPPRHFSVALVSTPAGVIDLPPQAEHLLTLHVGTPINVACRVDGKVANGLQVNGDITVVPAGVAGVWEDQESATFLMLRLSPVLLRSAAEGLGLDPDRASLTPQLKLRDPQIEHLCWALKAEVETGFSSGRLYSDSLGLALSAQLLRHYARPSARLERQGLSKQKLRRVIEHIDNNLGNELSLAELAALADLSASHFKTLFKVSTGQPVHQYVVGRRVARAKALIREGRLSMSQIALEAGFAHQSHMARCMRSALGLRPAELLRLKH